MATAAVDRPEPSGRRDAARRYPPLLFLILALIIAMAVLPSALTLPQANPSQTVEIAPVPPEDDTPPPPLGNVDQLSLGSSDSLTGAEGPGGDNLGEGLGDLPPLPPAAGGGAGKTKTTKKCARTPNGLRQTMDVTSPPCSADFSGDNGGATYQGVTGEEVRLILYEDGGIASAPTPRGTDNYPTSTLLDMDSPPQPNEIGPILTFRSWLAYFNDRFQTYGRRVHGYIYFGSANRTQSGRQADAAAAYSRVKPFATISRASYGGSADAYNVYMAQHGVLNFGSVQGRPAEFFTAFPKLIWGYPPSIEQQAKVYVDYVCTKIKGNPAVDAGSNGPENLKGLPRKFGFISTKDPLYPGVRRLGQVIKKDLEACGIEFAGTGEFPANGYAIDPVTPNQYAQQTMAEFSQKDITTILWGGGTEPNYSQQADLLLYNPEWILVGDGQTEAPSYAVQQSQNAWSHAWNISPVTRVETLNSEVCYQEYRTVDTTANDADVQNTACPMYNDLRQFFTGVQVAGPKLGPFSVDKGYHAIPPVESKDPRVPACFYEPNDYTCVKDAQAMWWDPEGQVPSQPGPGCWRMVDGGRRHIAGGWPRHNLDKDKVPGLVCNQYDANYNVNNNV